MRIRGPVEFQCWDTGESFESMEFNIRADDYEIGVVSLDCPYCDYGGHWKEDWEQEEDINGNV